VIGVLGSAPLPGSHDAFIQGLKAAGFLEAENIIIDWRWGEGQ
jgi:putative tryptophan/tyrosine transport system substrate-binding protein